MTTRLPRALASIVTLGLVLTATACGSDGGDGAGGAADARDAASGGGYPVEVESCERSSTYERAPERVVVGFPTTAETLVALGVGDAVVGYTSGSLAPPPRDLPNASEISPDYQAPREAVLAARPDLFLTNDENQLSGNDGGITHDDLAASRAAAHVLGDYCMEGASATSVDAVYRDVEDLGRIFGVPDRAEEVVADMRDRIAAAERGADRPGPSAAFVQVYDGTLYALTGSYYGMLLDTLGLRNELADVEESFAEISPERVLTLEPDVLLVVHDSASTRDAQLREATELLAATPAVAEDRVVGVLNADVTAGGVTFARVAEDTSRALWPAGT